MGRPKNSKNKVKGRSALGATKGGGESRLDYKARNKEAGIGLAHAHGHGHGHGHEVTNENVNEHDHGNEADRIEQGYNLANENLAANLGDPEIVVKKRKVAPRSGLQFKVGPSFDHTTLYRPIYITSTNESVFPFVNARVDRGFEKFNDEWIGYKRNYFTLVGCFELEDKSPDIFFTEKFHIVNDLGEQENISCFALRLVSRCSEDDMAVNLIQHTAKRDRGPQYLPPVFPAISGYLPPHSIIKQASNIRNGDKIDQFNKLFYLDSSALLRVSSDSVLSTYPEGRIATVARYERIQFSTSINYRKPTMVNRHFILKVELLGLLDDGKYAVLASTETQPLVVRGRSPSNYQIAKRNLKALASNEKARMLAQSPPDLPASGVVDDSYESSTKMTDVNFQCYNLKSSASEHLHHKPSKRGRKRKDKQDQNQDLLINWLPDSLNDQVPKPDLDHLDTVFKDASFSDMVHPRFDSFDPIFEPYPFHSGLDLNLNPCSKGKKGTKSKSRKKKSHRDKYTLEKAPNSACKPQSSTSSHNQLDDSFIEFQQELSMLQKELKTDLDGDHSMMGLVS